MTLKSAYRTSGLFIATSLVAALVVVASFWAYRQIEASAASRRQTFETIIRAESLLIAISDAETSQRGYVLTGDEAFLGPYQAGSDGVRNQLEILKQTTGLPSAQQHLVVAGPLVDAKLAELSQVIELRRSQDLPAVAAMASGGRGQRLTEAIRAELNEFIQIEKNSLARIESQFQVEMGQLLAVIVVASLLLVMVALMFTYYWRRQAKQRVENLLHDETKQLLEAQEALNARLQVVNDTLHASEENLAVTLNSIGDAVIATDADARVTSLNVVAEKLTGWPRTEASGRPVSDVFNIINQETRKPAAVPVLATLAKGTVQGLANHTLLIARDGSECAIADSCAPIRARDGRVIGAVLVFRNVTDEYATQQALRDSAVLMQTVLHSVGDGIITLRAQDGIVETVNPAVERMFAYAAPEILGKHLNLLLPTHGSGLIEQALAKNPTSDESQADNEVLEVMGRRKDGSDFHLEITLREMWLGGKRYFTGVLRDVTTRKETEEALLKAGALQRAIFNSANFSSIATDAKGVIQIFNVGAERMLGYSAEAVMNKVTPADISDPKEVIARAQALSKELNTQIEPGFEALVFKASRGIEDIYELTYIRKDGSRFPAIVSVTALRDPENEIIGYLLIGTDNTARKQAEQELLRAGALQSAIFNSANFSSIATDANGVIQIFNVGAERMLGYTAAEVMNKITPAAISDSKEVIARAQALSRELSTQIEPGFEALVFKASRGIEDIYELTYIRKDGTRFPAIVSVTALRDPQNEIIGYLLIGTDNTARKQIELAQEELALRLRDQQFYTRSLFESNIDALITTDPSGVITDANKQMEVLTGCRRDELIGGSFKSFFTDPERADAGIKLVLKDKTVTNYELTANSRDGKETVVSYNAATFYDRDRKLQGVYAAARDITDAKHMDQAMQEKNVELECARAVAEKANLAKSDFLSSMSHELRSPLNAILGFAQLLDSDSPPVTINQKASVSQILHAGWYLLELINEILDLTVIESGKLSLSAEPVSLGDVMTDCQAMIEPQGQKRGIHMAFPKFNEPLFVHADRIRLKQVLINLLSNAIKYNRAGGDVVVDCAVTTAGHTRISVRDTGQGLSPEKMRQLFQPFNRLGQESSGVEGTGIGLVMSKLLVELMGGKIGVESKVGVGSVFWYELNTVDAPQLVDEKLEAKASSQGMEPEGARVHTLLYVEDNPANLALVEQLIARRPDMELLTAVTGPLGVDLAREKRPDVILMDINLPGISGIQAMRMLRDDASTAFIPVIAISANAMQSDIKAGMEAGFFRYITKPIKVEEFMEALETALEFASHNHHGQ